MTRFLNRYSLIFERKKDYKDFCYKNFKQKAEDTNKKIMMDRKNMTDKRR